MNERERWVGATPELRGPSVSMASARAVAILNLPRFRGSATLPLLLRTFKLPGGPVDLPPDVDATLKPLPQSTISVDVDFLGRTSSGADLPFLLIFLYMSAIRGITGIRSVLLIIDGICSGCEMFVDGDNLVSSDLADSVLRGLYGNAP
jgi:hypothetical protein